MTKIVLNSETRAKLSDRTAGTEFTDEQGNVVGYLMSEESFERIASIVLPSPTDREIVEARKEMLENGGVSTEEVLAAIERANREWEARQ